MGTFLMMSGVAGAEKSEVAGALRRMTIKRSTGARATDAEEEESYQFAESDQGNVTVLYQDETIDWDDTSRQLSETLRKPVFSLHIHDGDLWMYLLFADGRQVDQFNPVPDYWEELSDEEWASWSGNAAVVSQYWPNVSQEQIANYLVRWDLKDEAEYGSKAYPEDEFGRGEDWQIVDFMAKVGLVVPGEDEQEPTEEQSQSVEPSHPKDLSGLGPLPVKNSRLSRLFHDHLQAQLPEFVFTRDLMYVPPLDYVLKAVLFDRTSTKSVFQIIAYMTPLFMPGAGSMLMIPERLGYFDLEKEDEESVARKITALVKKKAIPLFSRYKSSPEDVIRMFAQAKWSTELEPLAYALVLTKQWGEAVSTLERLLLQLQIEFDECPDASWYKEVIARVRQMLTLVKTEPPRAVERLEEYRLTALRELGIIK